MRTLGYINEIIKISILYNFILILTVKIRIVELRQNAQSSYAQVQFFLIRRVLFYVKHSVANEGVLEFDDLCYRN